MTCGVSCLEARIPSANQVKLRDAAQQERDSSEVASVFTVKNCKEKEKYEVEILKNSVIIIYIK